MNLQQLIDEKIAIGNKLIQDNPELTDLWFKLENIDPVELGKYAKEIGVEYDTQGDKLRLLVPKTGIGITIWLKSRPVKIKTQISFDFI